MDRVLSTVCYGVIPVESEYPGQVESWSEFGLSSVRLGLLHSELGPYRTIPRHVSLSFIGFIITYCSSLNSTLHTVQLDTGKVPDATYHSYQESHERTQRRVTLG